MINLPEKYLNRFKLHIRYHYYDLDEYFKDLLEVAAKNILTQYMEVKEEEFENEDIIDIINENKNFLLATLNLATSFYQNPDIMLTNQLGSVVDTNNIYRLLGNKLVYYKAERKRLWKK